MNGLVDLRTITAVTAAKAVGALSRRLGFGGGTALPGLVADAVAPGLASRLAARLGHGCVLITGTNGKTTTARLVRNITQADGHRPVHNHSGSNLMRGITACLIEAANVQGQFPQSEQRLGIFEVDEATLPEAAVALTPRVVAFTNLFRDQLDRYGEVESVAAVWRKTVASLPFITVVVLNADDPGVASLADACRGPVLFYSLRDTSCAVEQIEHAADARWCSSCGREYSYGAVFYGHVGHWSCPGCGRTRPAADIEATRVEQSPDGSLSLSLSTPSEQFDLSLPLMGLYNAYNALAAVSVGVALDVPGDTMQRGVSSFTAAFGRQERMTVRGREVQTILAKNPAGLNQVLRAISAEQGRKNLLFLLNDDIADGRDISWIWDVDFEMLAGQVALLLASGRRAADMALRLKYAAIAADASIETDTETALQKALALTPEGERLYVIPTYTAMLQVRKLLAHWGQHPPFWEEA